MSDIVVPQAEVLFRAKRFQIERVMQHASDGTSHAREVIRHPGAVAILPILDDGRVCFVENFRAAVGERLIELPAGTLEPGENPHLAAARELAEETGYRANRIAPLAQFCMSPGILDEKMHVYLATELTAGAMALEAGEDIRVVHAGWAEALEMVRCGKIRDAKSVAALLYYEAFKFNR